MLKSLNRKDAPLVSRLGLAGMVTALGIVFGDIGTSPLYVMKAITHTGQAVDEDYVIGAVSCVIWTLTLQTTVKYVLTALRADNNGEGGILALYALLRRHRRRWLYAIAIVGAGMLIADGVITPAITVVTAIEGLGSVVDNPPVLPVSAAIITIVFFVQQFGTKNIGRLFGPFMLVWFLMLGVFGAVAMIHQPAIAKAFNPLYAIMLLTHSPEWFLILGAVFLCTTGAEALYSDLGHCGRQNITVSWFFVKAMLILNYLGQGAWVLTHVEAAMGNVNPFYAIVPRALVIPAVVMATGAAIVASQALISGSYSIFSEAMNMRLWPRMRMKHPTDVKGQIYIPSVNWTMYVGVMMTILVFRSSAGMEAAYGLAITVTMLMTTLLLSFYLRTKGMPRLVVLLFLSVFGFIECIFLTANISKIAMGGWYTLLISGAVCGIMFVWFIALGIRRKQMRFRHITDYAEIISDIKNDTDIPKYASNLVYINHAFSAFNIDDKLAYSIINKRPKRADHYWIMHIEYTDMPDTLEYTFTPIVDGTLFCVNLRIGFRIEPRLSLYLRQIVEDLVANGELDLTSTYPSLCKHSIAGDFRFIIIRRVYYPEDTSGKRLNFIMALYSLIRKIGTTDAKALGLDTSVVTVERVPLTISKKRQIRRISRCWDE